MIGSTYDFVSARTVDGRWFCTLTVLDLYTRESLALVADRSLTGVKVAATLSQVLQHRSAPHAITVDNWRRSQSPLKRRPLAALVLICNPHRHRRSVRAAPNRKPQRQRSGLWGLTRQTEPTPCLQSSPRLLGG
jgi:hypothetical protein